MVVIKWFCVVRFLVQLLYTWVLRGKAFDEYMIIFIGRSFQIEIHIKESKSYFLFDFQSNLFQMNEEI